MKNNTNLASVLLESPINEGNEWWAHKNLTTGELLDGGGYEIRAYDAAVKVPLWPSRESAMKFMKRKFKGEEIREFKDRIEVTLPADPPGIAAPNPERTLAMVLLHHRR